MKKFTVPCDFGGQKSPFDLYIGMPKDGNHPLQNQANWLSSERGGNVPAEVMESFAKLLELAKKNGISFEELCVYALEEAEKKNEDESGDDQTIIEQNTQMQQPTPQRDKNAASQQPLAPNPEIQYNPVELQLAQPAPQPPAQAEITAPQQQPPLATSSVNAPLAQPPTQANIMSPATQQQPVQQQASIEPTQNIDPTQQPPQK